MTDADAEPTADGSAADDQTGNQTEAEVPAGTAFTIGNLSIELTGDGGLRFASASGDFVEFAAVPSEGERFTPILGEPALFEPAAGGGVTVDPTGTGHAGFDTVEWGGFTFTSLPNGEVRFTSLAEGGTHLEPTRYQGFRVASPGDPPMSGRDILQLNENTETPPPIYGPE